MGLKRWTHTFSSTTSCVFVFSLQQRHTTTFHCSSRTTLCQENDALRLKLSQSPSAMQTGIISLLDTHTPHKHRNTPPCPLTTSECEHFLSSWTLRVARLTDFFFTVALFDLLLELPQGGALVGFIHDKSNSTTLKQFLPMKLTSLGPSECLRTRLAVAYCDLLRCSCIPDSIFTTSLSSTVSWKQMSLWSSDDPTTAF